MADDKKPETRAARSPDAVSADLDAERLKFRAMHTAAHAEELRRQRAAARVENLKAEWKKSQPDEPFDPTYYDPPAVVPPADSPAQRAFHSQHYTIARLESELEAAKKAAAL